eukprot:30087-Pelagococcus_subviridis.AAC.23
MRSTSGITTQRYTLATTDRGVARKRNRSPPDTRRALSAETSYARPLATAVFIAALLSRSLPPTETRTTRADPRRPRRSRPRR